MRARIAAVDKAIKYNCDIRGQTFRNIMAIKSSKHDKMSLKNDSTEDEWEYIVVLRTRLKNFKKFYWEY